MLFQGEMRFTHFPYCLFQMEDGRYIMLNARHKPLGVNNRAQYVYEDHPSAMYIKGLTPKLALKLDVANGAKPGRIYLYSKQRIPTRHPDAMDDYLCRLATIMKLKTYSKE
jgi:hypothetical protein